MRGLDGDGTGRIPGVLTDRDAHAYSPEHEDRAAPAALEVPLFVEDAVVGEVHLVVDAAQLAVEGEEGGVVDVRVQVHEPADHGDAPARLHDAVAVA